jgi:hypothetical protein
MDDQASTENPEKDFNKIDLTQLQGFSFGTQWTQDKTGAREPRRDDRPRREGEAREPRRDGGGGPGTAAPADAKRDRRGFRRPAGEGVPVDGGGAPGGPGGGPGRDGGNDFRGGPRRDFRGGPRRDGPGGGERGEFRGGGGRFGSRDNPVDRGPYISPFFNITFYPEDVGFTALAKAIRTSCRTYELFEIARVIIGKNDRFVAVIQRKAADDGGHAPAEGVPAQGGKPAPLAISLVDGLPFESEEAAIAHVMSQHLGQFFDSAEVEVEPPKGNFQVINKCSITGELLGPPNYHRYNQITQQHFNARITRMTFEAYRSRIETVRDPEVVNQWLEKMKKTTRYTWKLTPPAEGSVALTFDSLEDAKSYLVTQARDKIVKLVDSARFHGKALEQLPPGEIRRGLEGALERQRRFPLDTANALRGRLRREGFTIFKKGSKGVSYVCAVKRKFRVPGQTFSDSIGSLIAFIEANPMIKASELPVKFLGIQPPTAPTPPAAPAGTTTSPIPTSGSMPPISLAAATALSPEDQAKLNRLNGDLRWLVTEGYVTEFIDGCLFAPPAMTEARKHEVEKDEHDPENFPEPAPQSAAAAPATEAAPETTAPASMETAPPLVADPADNTAAASS